MELKRRPDIAFADCDSIKKLQQTRLREHLLYCSNNSPYYKRVFHDNGIDLSKTTLENLSTLPFTEKSDLEEFNDDFCAVDNEKIVDIVLSSGSTGKPTRMMYSEYDLRRLAYNEEKAFAGCGVTAADTVLLTCTIDRCFVAGLAYFLGVQAVGAAAIRNGYNTLESQKEIITQMDPTVIVGVPTFLRKLALYMHEAGTDPGETSVSRLVCIGEPLRDRQLDLLGVGSDLERLWNAKVFSTYASSEIVTTFCECSAQQGGHLHPDLAIVEIVDQDGNPQPPGTVGEIVVTPPAVEGMPLVRFKTGDVSFLIDAPCVCGRNSVRLGPILGRKKQMLKVRGTTLYPQAVFTALDELDWVSEYYITVTSESEFSDNIEVCVAVKDNSCTCEMIQEKLRARLRLKPRVKIIAEEAVRRQVFTPKSRKPVRLIDKR
jgi:phenylacetate-CoA ligase